MTDVGEHGGRANGGADAGMDADGAHARGRPTDPERLAGVCRLVFVLMIASASLTVTVGSFGDGYAAWPATLVVGQSAICFVALRWWRRAGPLLSTHPAVLFVFLLGTVGTLTMLGPSSPFTFVLLAVCLLAGLLYDWRGWVLFPLVGSAGWLVVAGEYLIISPPLVVVGIPVLLALATVVGVGQRRLLDRQAAVELRLRAATRAAALADERARMARDMHDSVIKTLYGVSLQAQAIVRWARRDPEVVATTAQEITREVSDVADKVRELVGELRSKAGTSEIPPATRLVPDLCHRWSAATGIPVCVEVDNRCALTADATTELCMVLGEALENVRRHAGARSVAVSLRTGGGSVELWVDDDGRGLPQRMLSPGPGPAAAGRYGVVGMRERAVRLGGTLDLGRRPGGCGTRVRLRLPVDRDRSAEQPAGETEAGSTEAGSTEAGRPDARSRETGPTPVGGMATGGAQDGETEMERAGG